VSVFFSSAYLEVYLLCSRNQEFIPFYW
jgi:hypothetical protein